MPTAKKEQLVEELRDRIARSTIAVGTGYRGLTVPEMDQLRRRMRGAGVELRVVKNTLVRLAAEQAGKPALSQLIEGPTALAFGYGDILAVARAFSEYLPTAPPAFAIRAVYLDGQVLPGRELGELVRLPPKEVLLAQVAGQLQSPLATLAGLLEAPLTEMARLLEAVVSQLPVLLEARARQLESAYVRAREEEQPMTSKADEVFDLLTGMTILEVRDLSKRLQDEFGISAAPVAVAAAPAAAGAAAAPAPAEEEEKTEFTVVLKDFGANKINVIKAVREVTTLGLKEAKDLVEGVPANVKEGIPKSEAENIVKKLQEAGATVEMQ